MDKILSELENQYWKKHKQTFEFRHGAALNLIKSGPVLDIGCGDGLLLKTLKGREINGKGLDISKTAVEKCRKNNLEAVQFDISTGQLPFQNNEFKTVIALDVLEHLYEPEKLLKEIHKISGKYAVLSVPNFSSLPARIQTLMGKIPENNIPKKKHVYWMNLKTISSLLDKVGFKIEEIQMNTFWSKKPLLAIFAKFGLKLFPQAFALSFVIKAKKQD